MKMVEESKNERLTMLLGKTNELLGRLGAAVQRQKDADHDGAESLEGSDADMAASKTDTPGQSLPEEEEDVLDDESTHDVKTSDLLEGQRKYNSAVHSIQEKVKKHTSSLLSFTFNSQGLLLKSCAQVSDIECMLVAKIGPSRGFLYLDSHS